MFLDDLNARHMSELSAMMRQACKEDAEQNKDSNQHTNSHHNIHLKSHTSNSISHIQHSDQINLDTQSHSLAHELECCYENNEEKFLCIF